MKKYVEVFWTPFVKDDTALLNIFTPPKPLMDYLNTTRKNAQYLKCPAFQETIKNEFVIRAPFDLNITVKKETREIFTDRYGQDFYNKNVYNRSLLADANNPFALTLPPRYTMYAKDNVSIEVKDLSLLTSKSSSNIKIIPGGFNISKWIRPIEFAVEVIDDTKPIELCIGEPIFSVRFITPNNVPVKLIRVENSDFLYNVTKSCVEVKRYIPNLKLPELYKMAESYLSLLIKK